MTKLKESSEMTMKTQWKKQLCEVSESICEREKLLKMA